MSLTAPSRPRQWSGKVNRKLQYGLGVCALALLAAALAYSARTRVTGDSAEERVASICRLTNEAPAGAAGAIAAVAGDPEPSVRRAVMVALGKFKRPDDRGVLAQGARDADGGVRGAAAATLGFYADEAAAANLCGMLANDPQADARRGAAIGLARCRRKESMAVLLRAMEADEDPAVRREAFGAVVATVGVKYANPPDPANRLQWGKLVEVFRSLPPVRDALAGAPRRPEAR